MAENSSQTAKKPRGRGRPFQKGQSGNPGGRPSIPEHVVEAARAHTVQAIETLVDVMKTGGPAARVTAANSILDRAWGRAIQPMEMTGPNGGPIQTEDKTPKRPRLTPQEWLMAHGIDLKEIADVGPATGKPDIRVPG